MQLSKSLQICAIYMFVLFIDTGKTIKSFQQINKRIGKQATKNDQKNLMSPHKKKRHDKF